MTATDTIDTSVCGNVDHTHRSMVEALDCAENGHEHEPGLADCSICGFSAEQVYDR